MIYFISGSLRFWDSRTCENVQKFECEGFFVYLFFREGGMSFLYYLGKNNVEGGIIAIFHRSVISKEFPLNSRISSEFHKIFRNPKDFLILKLIPNSSQGVKTTKLIEKIPII